MKQQFTYALDETKIRKQLQDLTLANTDEAWQKFAQFSDNQPRQASSKKFPALRLQVNRRILVPAAAAAVIVVLAILLFNLVNIKGTDGKETQKAAIVEPFVPMPQISEAETILPPPEKRSDQENHFAENTQALEASKPEVIKEKINKQEDPVAKKPALVLIPMPEAEKQQQLQPATTHTEVKKKQRRESEDLLEAVQLPDIRPTLLTEEQVEDIRID